MPAAAATAKAVGIGMVIDGVMAMAMALAMAMAMAMALAMAMAMAMAMALAMAMAMAMALAMAMAMALAMALALAMAMAMGRALTQPKKERRITMTQTPETIMSPLHHFMVASINQRIAEVWLYQKIYAIIGGLFYFTFVHANVLTEHLSAGLTLTILLLLFPGIMLGFMGYRSLGIRNKTTKDELAYALREYPADRFSTFLPALASDAATSCLVFWTHKPWRVMTDDEK